MCDSPVPNSPLKGWAIYPKFLLHCIINMHSIDIAENCWNSRFIFPIACIHVLLSWCLCQIELSLTALNGHQQPWRCSWLSLANGKSMKMSARSERSAWCLRKKGWKTVTQIYSAIKKKKKKVCAVQSLYRSRKAQAKRYLCFIFLSPFLYLLQVTIATLNTLTHILLLLLYNPPGFFF